MRLNASKQKNIKFDRHYERGLYQLTCHWDETFSVGWDFRVAFGWFIWSISLTCFQLKLLKTIRGSNSCLFLRLVKRLSGCRRCLLSTVSWGCCDFKRGCPNVPGSSSHIVCVRHGNVTWEVYRFEEYLHFCPSFPASALEKEGRASMNKIVPLFSV